MGGQGDDTGKEDDSMSDGSGSSSDDDTAFGKGKKKHRKHGHGHWKRDKKEKNDKKDKPEGLPRKAFKKLIKKELDKQCNQIFENLFNGQNGEMPQQEPGTE